MYAAGNCPVVRNIPRTNAVLLRFPCGNNFETA